MEGKDTQTKGPARHCMIVGDERWLIQWMFIFATCIRSSPWRFCWFFIRLLHKRQCIRQAQYLDPNLGLWFLEWPGGDLAQRFGQSLSFHSGMEWNAQKNKVQLWHRFQPFLAIKSKGRCVCSVSQRKRPGNGHQWRCSDLFIRAWCP